MKTAHYTLLLLVFLASCTSENKANEESKEQVMVGQLLTNEEIREELEPDIKSFRWTGKGDTILVGDKGTKVFLPDNCLEMKTKDPVDIELTEYYSFSEFFAGNLTTKCGDQLLETGGMINLKVTQNGTELSLKKDKEYAVLFPKGKESNKKMGTFYGSMNEDGQVVWEEEKKDIKASKKGDNATMPEQYSNLKIRFGHKISSQERIISLGSESIGWKLAKTGDFMPDYVANNIRLSEEIAKEMYENDLRTSLEISYKKDGTISDIRLKRSSKPEYDTLFIDFIRNMPPVDMETMSKVYNGTSTYYIVGFGGSLDNTTQKEEFIKEFKVKYASITDNVVKKIENAELNYYVLSVTNFGWINCDRFWNTPDEKIDFVVDAGKIKDLNLKLVFGDIKSIMAATKEGDKYIFKNIPVGRKVKLVGIGNDGEVTKLGIARTNISKSVYQLNAFNPFKLAELEEQLNSI